MNVEPELGELRWPSGWEGEGSLHSLSATGRRYDGEPIMSNLV